jgi:hypothetical protein
MECETLRLQIAAYFDGVLSPAEQDAFETHRATCRDCQRAVEKAQQLGGLLRAELPKLATASPSEQVMLRETALERLGMPSAERAARISRRIWIIRSLVTALVLVVALVATLVLLPDSELTVSAAEIVHNARATTKEHQGMDGVLYWEAEWSERFPSGDGITRTFEIWFDFDNPGQYHLTQRDPDGRVVSELVRDGRDHMWQLSRSTSADGQEQIQVDEVILSPEEMQRLGSWYVPSPFLDDLNRFAEALSGIERVAVTEVAGRPAYVLRGQLFGFGQPGAGNRMEPVTSTVQLVVDAETFWVLGRTERVPGTGHQKETVAGIVQRTRRFAIVSPERVPANTFGFTPPPAAEVRTVKGISDYYAPISSVVDLEDTVKLTRFAPVVPSNVPPDLRQHSVIHYRGPGQSSAIDIVYWGRPGRQAHLRQYEQAGSLEQAARVVAVGERQGWLVPDPIYGHRFSLHLIEPGPRDRRWPGDVELDAWGLSLDEAVAMLASLEPYKSDQKTED